MTNAALCAAYKTITVSKDDKLTTYTEQEILSYDLLHDKMCK